MDINSRLKWKPGVVMTAEAMTSIDDNQEVKQLMSIRAAVGHRYGLLPNMPFNAEGFFVDGCFEIPHLKCTALLPSGMMVNVDEPVRLKMAKLHEGVYYLCVGYGTVEHVFEKEDIEFSRPSYDYSVMSGEEIDKDDVIPVSRFSVNADELSLDNAFIPPCMLVSGDTRFMDFRDSFVATLKKILSHPNMEEGDGKFNIGRYFIHLKSLVVRNTADHFMQMTIELANTLKYFIMEPNGHAEQLPEVLHYDCEKWLSWLDGYMHRALDVLEEVVVDDKSIDIEALKTSIEDDLHGRLKDELSSGLLEELRKVLGEDIDGKVGEVLRDYIDGTFRNGLHDALSSELDDKLGASLYDRLYPALYGALYVPPKEESDDFTPMI